MTFNEKQKKIYKLTCSKTKNVYIGSTTQPLSWRLKQHLNKDHNSTCSKNFIEPKIELLCQVECNNVQELLEIEKFYIKNTPNCINIQIPLRSSVEYYHDNKLDILKKKKIYYQNNKKKLKIRRLESKKKLIIKDFIINDEKIKKIDNEINLLKNNTKLIIDS